MDTLTKSQRHDNMSRIRSSDTMPERTVRSALHRMGFRFRKNDRRYPGTPDIVLPHYHAVIFVNGCFWHAHIPQTQSYINYTHTATSTICSSFPTGGGKCTKYRLPKSNTEFWRKKLERNRARDKQEIERLLKDGWRVGIVWECSITGKKRAAKIRNTAEEISLWLEEGFSEPFREF